MDERKFWYWYCIVIVLLIAFLYVFGEYKGCDIYSNQCESSLSLEQRVACFKGCQFTTQPIYENCVNDSVFRQEQYAKCIEKCEDWYAR